MELFEKLTAQDFAGEEDMYIVDKHFTWTYAITHHSDYGPYFRENKIFMFLLNFAILKELLF